MWILAVKLFQLENKLLLFIHGFQVCTSGEALFSDLVQGQVAKYQALWFANQSHCHMAKYQRGWPMPLKFTSCEDFLKNNTNSTEDKNKFYTTGREEGTCLQLLRIQLEILPKFLNWIYYTIHLSIPMM